MSAIMNRVAQLERSRACWKSKAVERGRRERYRERETTRIKREREHYKRVAKDALATVEQLERQRHTPALCGKVDLVYMALQLFLVARIGFRAVSRVLGIMGEHLGLAKAPCPQTIINWVARLSIARLQCAPRLVGAQVRGAPFCNGFIWMIDTSIGLGAGKILAVLALHVRHHQDHPGAATLQDVHCVGVSVAVSWTGEAIGDFLQRLIAVLGRPVAFLKDGARDLAKAVRLLDEQGLPSLTIDDISHGIANLLKQAYGEHPLFDIFLSACGKASQKLKQTVLACLAPPKVSTKARFMNVHRLVRWADRVLKHSPVGRVSSGSVVAKLRASLDQLPACKVFIARFLRDAHALLACQEMLKTKGLSQATWMQCEKLIDVIPASSSVRVGFRAWGERHLKIVETLAIEPCGLPITSDQIESLYGIAKQHGVGETKDVHRIAARLPALCGNVTPEDARQVLGVSVVHQEAIMGSLPSLTKQRRQILPNPGSLATLAIDAEKPHLELLPGVKKRAKNQVLSNISNNYENENGPVIPRENRAIPPPKASPAGPMMAGWQA
jgi:hypothetical protein